MKNKKVLIIASIVLALIVGIFGITYAMFNYSRSGVRNSKLVAGDIYMHYSESTALTLANAFPSNTYDSSKYFEFTIDGVNEYTEKDIWYEIVLSKGAVPTGKQEANRIADQYLKFTLMEKIDNGNWTTVVDGKSYNDLTSKRIWVDKIEKETTTETVHYYKLYMWISDSVKIGNTNEALYTLSEWENVFASIKVNVTGDFEEKYLTTPPQCFTTSDNGNNTVAVTGYEHSSYVVNSNMTSGELQTCVNHLTSEWGVEEEGSTVDVGETYQAFCNGTGTYWGETFKEWIDYYFSPEELEYFAEENIIQSELAPSYCTSDVIIPSTINNKTVTTIGDNAFKNNKLISVTIPNSVTTIGDSAFSSNQLTSVVIPDSVTTIEEVAFEWNQLTSVTIGNGITSIANGAFVGNQLTSVTIGNGITSIGDWAFANNQLTSVEIPNSVTTIGEHAFEWNQLTSVTIGNGITTIGEGAFAKGNITNQGYYQNPNLTSITINKSCSDIKNNLLASGTNYYPWLSDSSPYRGIGGVTIYGSGNTVCDTF